MFIAEARELFWIEVESLLLPKNAGIKIGPNMKILTSADKPSIPKNAGEIHFSDGLPILAVNASLKEYTRFFRYSAISSFINLAEKCRENDPVLNGIEFFYGISPLVKKSTIKYGFTIEEVDFLQKARIARKHKDLIKAVAGSNRYWWRFREVSGKPKKATITRDALIEHF